MRALTFVSAAALAALACNPYDPNLGDRPFKCGTSDPRCPDGYTCSGSGASAICQRDGAGDAGTADASHAQCGSDSTEPNDDTIHAFATPVDKEADYSLAKLAICPAGDVDLYSFYTSTVGEKVRITLTYDPTQGTLTMQLLNANAVAVDTAKASGNNLLITIPPDVTSLSLGEWFVLVKGADPSVQTTYSLDINAMP